MRDSLSFPYRSRYSFVYSTSQWWSCVHFVDGHNKQSAVCYVRKAMEYLSLASCQKQNENHLDFVSFAPIISLILFSNNNRFWYVIYFVPRATISSLLCLQLISLMRLYDMTTQAFQFSFLISISLSLSFSFKLDDNKSINIPNNFFSQNK